MLNILVKDGDFQISVTKESTDFVLMTEDKKVAEQNISHHVALIRTTYNIRPSLGIPWLDYLNKLQNSDADNLIITYIYDRVMNYPGIVPNSTLVTLNNKENRNAYFTITATYNDELIELSLEGGLGNVNIR